ncbi:hypothetical protein K1719_002604 [Acacia pycnantha]|nr:hypothetical protein K1719_002604 [Acacia pycnantha]
MRRLIATLGKKVVPPIHQSGAPEILRHGSFGSVPTASDLSLIMRLSSAFAGAASSGNLSEAVAGERVAAWV